MDPSPDLTLTSALVALALGAAGARDWRRVDDSVGWRIRALCPALGRIGGGFRRALPDGPFAGIAAIAERWRVAAASAARRAHEPLG